MQTTPSEIGGVGPRKLAQFGPAFLAVTRAGSSVEFESNPR